MLLKFAWIIVRFYWLGQRRVIEGNFCFQTYVRTIIGHVWLPSAHILREQLNSSWLLFLPQWHFTFHCCSPRKNEHPVGIHRRQGRKNAIRKWFGFQLCVTVILYKCALELKESKVYTNIFWTIFIKYLICIWFFWITLQGKKTEIPICLLPS